ncbi:hypothetical protein D0466_16410 [Peribacillus glennii]|uniref:Uncharacterized protein n=1 Tax=Peribacillus glennii TaxID=2303991 RepID=A0A372LAB5_9BACI|nr:hypothetical protein D0466_16410 [Peribacillus glennii]
MFASNLNLSSVDVGNQCDTAYQLGIKCGLGLTRIWIAFAATANGSVGFPYFGDRGHASG